jgi:hypothetical protein
MIVVCALAVIGAFTVLVVAALLGLTGYFVWSDFSSNRFGDRNRMKDFRVNCQKETLIVKAANPYDALLAAKQIWLSETFLTRQQLEGAVCECVGQSSFLPRTSDEHSDGVYGPGND